MSRRLATLRLSLFMAALWVALATALVSAVAPGGLPRSTPLGSAFNPSTTAVALNPLRPAPRMTADIVRDDDGPAAGADDSALAADAPPRRISAGADRVPLIAAFVRLPVRPHPVLDGSLRGPPLA